jgi:hypothetical protein
MHDVIPELKKLIPAHYEEVSRDHDIPLNPDWDKYMQLQDNGCVRVFTARDEFGELIGYNVFFVHKNLHYQSSVQASQDVIYIDKEKRGFGRRFIDWCDVQLGAEGVQKVYHHVKAKHNFGPMLEKLGYELADLVYARRLDKVN